jgi:hypothetical protein
MDGVEVAEYRLYDGRTTQFLGAHHTLGAALASADEHSLAVLSTVGEWVVVEHLIVQVRERGRVELMSEFTHVGLPDDVEACRRWLQQLPGRDGAPPA